MKHDVNKHAFCKMLAFPTKNEYNDNFSLAKNLVESINYIPFTEKNHKFRMFGFRLFKTFRCMETRYYTNNFEPMIPIFFENTKGGKQIISSVSQPGQIQVIVFNIDIIIIKYRKQGKRLKNMYIPYFPPKNFRKQLKLTQKSEKFSLL